MFSYFVSGDTQTAINELTLIKIETQNRFQCKMLTNFVWNLRILSEFKREMHYMCKKRSLIIKVSSQT